jgi:hypothetical protein
MKSNFQLKALHVSGSCNEIADALSRFQQDRFLALESLADPVGKYVCIFPVTRPSKLNPMTLIISPTT